MGESIQSGIVFGLFIIAGWLLIAKTRSNREDKNSGILRWTGHGLLVLTAGLMILEVYLFFEEASHRIGH